MTSLRLNKYIASQTRYARRQVDELISRGQVTLAGQVAKLGDKLNPDAIPPITIRGHRLMPKTTTFSYIALNKPSGYVVTRAQFPSEQSVMTLLPGNLQHLRPIGRLDKQSEGLLLFSDDGDLIQQLTHPSFQHAKAYIVAVKYPLQPADLAAWRQGIVLTEGNTGKNPSVRQLDDTHFSISLTQGWNRQIRRMVEARRNRVRHLQRVQVGKLELGNLPVGQWQAVKRSDLC